MRIIGMYFLLVCLLSCSKDSSVENIYSVPDEFKLDLTQILSENGAIPAFKLITLDKIGCSEQELKTEYVRQTNNAFIKIIGVEIVESCLTSDYITAEIADYFDNGLYNFMVQVKNQVENEGTFSVVDNYFTINMHKSPNIKIGNTRVEKLPVESLWGAIYFTENFKPEILENFKDILHSSTTSIPNLSRGEYGLFRINKSDAVILDKFSQYSGYYGFCLKKNMEESNFIIKMKSFFAQYPGAKLFLASDKKILLEL